MNLSMEMPKRNPGTGGVTDARDVSGSKDQQRHVLWSVPTKYIRESITTGEQPLALITCRNRYIVSNNACEGEISACMLGRTVRVKCTSASPSL
jgi:hypothetical protein